LQLAAGYVIGRMIVSTLFLPRYFRGAMVTSYQLLQQRFGSSVNTISAGLFLFTRSLADGIRLYVTALAISIVTGIPVNVAVLVLGVAMIFYTVRGGSAAVIWTDVVQMFTTSPARSSCSLRCSGRSPVDSPKYSASATRPASSR
jgi:Na+/proline symporter